MAGAKGLEPAASCVTGRRSNQLNYAPAYQRSSDSFRFPPMSLLPCRTIWRAVRGNNDVQLIGFQRYCQPVLDPLRSSLNPLTGPQSDPNLRNS
jgi:hypothetical protein